MFDDNKDIGNWKSKSSNEIKCLMEIAKLNQDEYIDLKQLIGVESLEKSTQHTLLELPKFMISEILNSDQGEFEIKSNEHDAAFMCTKDASYAINNVEISNTNLISSDLYIPKKVDESLKSLKNPSVVNCCLTQSNYLEIVKTKSLKIHHLKNILLPYVMMNHIEDDPINSPLTLEELTSLVPASNQEIKRALRRLKILQSIFSYTDEFSIDWKERGIDINHLLEKLESLFPKDILKYVISLYFYPMKNSKDPETNLMLHPHEHRVCQLIGEHLLTTIKNKFALNDFLEVWRTSVPYGMEIDLQAHLTRNGRAMSKSIFTSKDKTNSLAATSMSIQILKSEDLIDESIEDRVRFLFEKSDTWPEFELASYFYDMVLVPDEKIPSWIMLDDMCFSEPEMDDTDKNHVPAVISNQLSKYCRLTGAGSVNKAYTLKHSRV